MYMGMYFMFSGVLPTFFFFEPDAAGSVVFVAGKGAGFFFCFFGAGAGGEPGAGLLDGRREEEAAGAGDSGAGLLEGRREEEAAGAGDLGWMHRIFTAAHG
jgi:hypothetical protein